MFIEVCVSRNSASVIFIYHRRKHREKDNCTADAADNSHICSCLRGRRRQGAQTPEPSVDLSTLIPDPTEILGGKTVKVREKSAGIYSISIHNCSKDEAKKYIDLLKAGKWTKNAEYTDKLIASAFTAEDESGKLGVKAEFSPLQKILRVTVKKTTPETGAVGGGQTE